MRSKLWRVLVCAIVFCLLLPGPHPARAQVAGLGTLAVFDLGSAARTAGLGLDYLALFDNDLGIGLDNPSLLHSGMSHTALLTYTPLFEGSNMGSLAYALQVGQLGTLALGFHFVNYGRFHGYDEEDNYVGDFGAGDYSLSVGWGMWLDSNFSVGVGFKPVLSQYEQYTAFALVFDAAASFTSTNRRLTATLMARNVGAQVVTFDRQVEHLPFELSAELSYKLRNAPFRLFLAATELQQWDLAYEDPLHPTTQTDPFTGEVSRQTWLEGTLDNLLRHTLVGVEFNLGKAFFARVGYSYRQNAEMRGFDAFNLSGFAFGVGLRTKKFEFGYARRDYHLAQAPNFLTLSYRF